jgi:hypothetical protein
VRTLVLVAVAACSDPGTDVVGPFRGPVQRFVVDSITIPRDTQTSDAFAGDPDGDGTPENQLGVVTAVLGTTGDLTIDAPDMILSGALASTIEIQGDDRAGVSYFGAEGDAAIVAGGRFEAGAFRSNRTSETRVPGRATVRLPIFTNADPLALEIDGLELDLDPDGAGGYTGVVRGGIREEHARSVSYIGLIQMFETEPTRHLVFARLIDTNHDGILAREEVDETVIALLVSAEIQLFDGTRYAPQPGSPLPDSISVAFGIHLSPCPDGRCTTGTPATPCRDRVRDGDETDVDCGGSCQTCAAAKTCSVPADCQSGTCTAGRCGAASCTNGRRDGYESDVDCGGVCPTCAAGAACAADRDCASSSCDNGVASVGVCITAAR